ncbi:MAG: sugar transferase [Defluviitaleaceae bacterium]|nr:sugar transferase [Defluviitaleaceae bacterium]
MYGYIKRLIDLLLIIAFSPLWIPLMAVIALCVKLSSPGPIFFKQKRYGKNLRFFQIYKFRSMYIDAPKDVPTHLLQNPKALITPVGRFLRKTSLDELPQIFNIIKSDLTLIGPRPALWNQDDLIAEREKYGANAIQVGLTGLAQVSGRDELPIPQKAALDGEYARRMGFMLDVGIIIKTVFGVVLGKDISN